MMRLKSLMMLVALAVVMAGCSWSSDSKHVPPDGMGSIIVLNNSGTSFNVTINGVLNAAEMEASARNPYDLRPGTYIITIEQNGGSRRWTGGVSVQLGRLTYMDVNTDPVNPSLYDVVTMLE